MPYYEKEGIAVLGKRRWNDGSANLVFSENDYDVLFDEDEFPLYQVQFDSFGLPVVIPFPNLSAVILADIGIAGNDYKRRKRDELLYFIVNNIATGEITRDISAIRTQYTNFKADVIAATTKGEVDTLFDTAYTWLTS